MYKMYFLLIGFTVSAFQSHLGYQQVVGGSVEISALDATSLVQNLMNQLVNVGIAYDKGVSLENEHFDHLAQPHVPGMPFDFNYAVKDDYYGTDFGHQASSNGDQVRGEYRVLLPDGRLQIVKYIADWKDGYTAEVTYQGEAKYPQPVPGASGGQIGSGGYPGARPTGGYPSGKPSGGYSGAGYSGGSYTQPTAAGYPSSRPTAGYPSPQPTAGYPSSQPTAGYGGAQPSYSGQPISGYGGAQQAAGGYSSSGPDYGSY